MERHSHNQLSKGKCPVKHNPGPQGRSYLQALVPQHGSPSGAPKVSVPQNPCPGVGSGPATPAESKAPRALQLKRQQALLRPTPNKDLMDLRKKWADKMERLKTSLVENPTSSEKKVFALDCEMVAVTVPHSTKKVHKAASVCMVDSEGKVVYSSLISQQYPIYNCFTWITGIKRHHLRRAPSLQKVKNDLSHILRGNILVGHGLPGDLKSLEMQHPISDQRDTQAFFMGNLPPGERKTNLKLMASVHLDRQIQAGSCHDPAEDALATLDLYLLYKDEVDVDAQVEYRDYGDDYDEYLDGGVIWI